MNPQARTVVVILTSGTGDNGQRATLAFSSALSALAMNQPAVVFLTGDGTAWSSSDALAGVQATGFAPLSQLVDQFVSEGGRILLCSTCVGSCHATPVRDDAVPQGSLRPQLAGFSTILELALDGGVTMTF